MMSTQVDLSLARRSIVQKLQEVLADDDSSLAELSLGSISDVGGLANSFLPTPIAPSNFTAVPKIEPIGITICTPKQPSTSLYNMLMPMRGGHPLRLFQETKLPQEPKLWNGSQMSSAQNDTPLTSALRSKKAKFQNGVPNIHQGIARRASSGEESQTRRVTNYAPHDAANASDDRMNHTRTLLKEQPKDLSRRYRNERESGEVQQPRQKRLKTSHTSFALPVNIAVQNRESVEMIEVLVDAKPEALCMIDGPDCSGTLGIALRRRPKDIDLVDKLLVANPHCVKVPDRRMNLPLHVACLKAPLDVIRHVHMLYPEAILKKNISGETPLDVACRTSFCTDKAVAFLQMEFNRAQSLNRLS